MVVWRRGESRPLLRLRRLADSRLEVMVYEASRYSSARLRSEAATLDSLSEVTQGRRLLGLLNLMTSDMAGAPQAARPNYAQLAVRGICSGGLPSLGKRR